jgi:ABC-type nitrate/sulfonate/bicarbonate transport system permease component
MTMMTTIVILVGFLIGACVGFLIGAVSAAPKNRDAHIND